MILTILLRLPARHDDVLGSEQPSDDILHASGGFVMLFYKGVSSV